MKINIHLVSHPIIQSLSSLINSKKRLGVVRHNALRQLGLFMTYETLRSWAKSYTIHIRQKQLEKEIIVADPKESYVIILNDLENLSFLQDMRSLIPKSKLELIRENSIKIESNLMDEFSHIDLYTKVIIVTQKLNSRYVMKILNELMLSKISINHIRLMCITCNTKELINLDQKYKNINIFTSRITEN